MFTPAQLKISLRIPWDMEAPAFLATFPDPHPLPDEIAEQHERQHALTQAVQALPRGSAPSCSCAAQIK